MKLARYPASITSYLTASWLGLTLLKQNPSHVTWVVAFKAELVKLKTPVAR